jgi:hypothetical protein
MAAIAIDSFTGEFKIDPFGCRIIEVFIQSSADGAQDVSAPALGPIRYFPLRTRFNPGEQAYPLLGRIPYALGSVMAATVDD